MKPRYDLYQASPGALQAMLGLEQHLSGCGLDKGLLHLVKLRASQINGCAFCVDMHTAQARADGESERRLHSVVTWRDAPFFDERERAALAWDRGADAARRRGDTGAGLRGAAAHFSERAIADLSLAIVTINGWNRLVRASGKAPE